MVAKLVMQASALVVVSLVGVGAVSVDLCYIHTGCDSASYCDQECCDANGGCYGGAPAWFCDDGQQLDGNTEFDPCEIHQGCASPSSAMWDGSKWVCSDTQPSTPIATQWLWSPP